MSIKFSWRYEAYLSIQNLLFLVWFIIISELVETNVLFRLDLIHSFTQYSLLKLFKCKRFNHLIWHFLSWLLDAWDHYVHVFCNFFDINVCSASSSPGLLFFNLILTYRSIIHYTCCKIRDSATRVDVTCDLVVSIIALVAHIY
jgi:hypothetical protein